MQKQTNWGYVIGVLGVSSVLIWLGIYKFTPTEAKLIEPLIQNHPLMSRIFNLLSVQQVSNLVGAVEIVAGVGLLMGLRNPVAGFISGLAASGIFLVTLSFMLTTPDTFKVSDGVPITNFFLLKDLVFLAVSVMAIEANKQAFEQYIKRETVPELKVHSS